MMMTQAKKHNDFSILIVDDEPDLVEMIAFDLERIGYRVVTATSGNEALNRFKDGRFDLVITDVRMPHGDGLALMKNLKSLNAGIPVVCITGYSEVSTSYMMDLGAHAVFEKPFDIKKLRNVLAEYFGLEMEA